MAGSIAPLFISMALLTLQSEEGVAERAPAADPLEVAIGHLESDAPHLAVEILAALADRRPGDPGVSRLYGAALLAAGRVEEAARALARVHRSSPDAAAACYDAARAHALLGSPARAVRWLDRAWQAGFRDLARLRADPDLATLAGDERYERLILAFEASLEPFPDHIRVIHEFRGRESGESFGWVGIDAGDVDGDGIRDAAISAPFARQGGEVRGRVEVRSGRTGELLHELWGAGDERFGAALGAVGDWDGDGRADLAVGAPGAEDIARAGAGRVTVWSGRSGDLLAEQRGAQAGERFGSEARGAGDWDGDGTRDLLVGSPAFDGPNGEDAGRVQILSGRDLAPLHVFDGERAGDRLGRAAWAEARPEGHFLVIGAGKAGPDRLGRAYLYRGARPDLLATIDADESGGSLGESYVSVVGDVDADGVPDFAVSDWRNRARGRDSGRVTVHSGADGARLRTLTGSHGAGFGIGDAVAGDVDGDGHHDLIVGAWLLSRGASGGGAAFLISGRTSEVLETWTGRTVGDHVGFDATGIGDVDGDGAPDHLITAASSSIHGPDTGRAFVVAGPKYYRRPSAGEAKRTGEPE